MFLCSVATVQSLIPWPTLTTVHKELFRAHLNSSANYSSSNVSEMRAEPKSRSQAEKAETSETALSTVSDVRNLTMHPRFKRKIETKAGLSYKPHTALSSSPTDQGLSTESNSTTHTMHPNVFRNARREYNHNRDATDLDRSRQTTPSSYNSSLSSLTLATSEHEVSDKPAPSTKDSLILISPKDTKDHLSRTEDVKGTLATVAPDPQPQVAPEDKGRKSRQSSQSRTASSRVLTRNAARAAKATRGQPEDDLHPEGPRHLEYDVTKARQNYEEAVYAALYDHLGYAPTPMHRRSHVGFNPNIGPEDRAVIKADWRVLKAAKILNETHKQVQDALAKGETWENTPIPEEWNWGSEFLQPLEHLRVLCDEPVELHPVKAKRDRKHRASENLEPPKDTRRPMTRKQKERAAANSEATQIEVQASIEVLNTQPPVLKVDAALESLSKRPRGRPRKIQSEETAASSSTSAAGCATVTDESTSIPTEASAPDGIATSESLPSVPAKRSRGRPRKRKLEDIAPSLTSKDVTTNSSAPLRQSKRRRTTL